MKLNLNLNEDTERYLQIYLRKNKKLTITKLINNILLQWVEDNDIKRYNKDKKKESDDIPSPEDKIWDNIELSELIKYAEHWADEHGSNAVLYNDKINPIEFKILKDNDQAN